MVKRETVIIAMTKLFKPYIVKRDKGQCQILLPLVELDGFVEKLLEKVENVL